MYRALRAFRGEASFSTSMTTIALNTYRSRVRAVNAESVSLDPARAVAAGAGAEQSDSRQRDDAVRRAVLTCPSDIAMRS